MKFNPCLPLQTASLFFIYQRLSETAGDLASWVKGPSGQRAASMGFGLCPRPRNWGCSSSCPSAMVKDHALSIVTALSTALRNTGRFPANLPSSAFLRPYETELSIAGASQTGTCLSKSKPEISAQFMSFNFRNSLICVVGSSVRDRE
jgi:hypothetical protein